MDDDGVDIDGVEIDPVGAFGAFEVVDVVDVIETHHPIRAPGRLRREAQAVRDRWRARLPRWVRHPPRVPTIALVTGVLIALGLAVVLVAPEHSAVRAVSSAPVHPVSVSAPSEPDSSPSVDPDVVSRNAMVALADSTQPLTDYQVAGFYPHCPWGTEDYPDPVNAVVAAVHSYLPAFSLDGATRGVDPAGVCSLRVRETDAQGSVLVVGVDSPPTTGGAPGVLTQTSGSRTVVDVVGVTVDRWRLEALATGVTGQLPTVSTLQKVLSDPRMTW